ncbi:MAG: VOC family protein [Candidatus Dormibacteria bacterium]
MPVASKRKLFVNLACEDLQRSVEFFTALGFTFDPHFTDHSATCMLIGQDAYVMLLTRERFAEFAPRPLCDSKQRVETLLCVSADTREGVDEMVRTAVSAGGAAVGAAQESSFMYGRSFQDPDGHGWEVMWMDPAFVTEAPGAVAATAG